MADNYLRVNTQRLSGDAGNMTDILRQTETAVNEMYREVLDLNGMWQGNANTAFANEFSNNYNEIKSYLSKLYKFFNRISQESRSYQSCEQTVTGMVDNIRI